MSITGTTGMSQTSASWLDDSKNLKNHEVNTRAKNKMKAERKGEKKYAGTSNPSKCLRTALLTQTSASNQI